MITIPCPDCTGRRNAKVWRHLKQKVSVLRCNIDGINLIDLPKTSRDRLLIEALTNATEPRIVIMLEMKETAFQTLYCNMLTALFAYSTGRAESLNVSSAGTILFGKPIVVDASRVYCSRRRFQSEATDAQCNHSRTQYR